MTPGVFAATVMIPGAALAAQHGLDSHEARLLLMAIAGQESGWSARTQNGGPARGYWQEETEAVQQVFAGADTGPLIRAVCAALDVPAAAATVYAAIAWSDPLAYAVARLTLLPDPAPLPAVRDEAGALAYYRRVWRPGRFAPERWHAVYVDAVALASVSP